MKRLTVTVFCLGLLIFIGSCEKKTTEITNEKIIDKSNTEMTFQAYVASLETQEEKDIFLHLPKIDNNFLLSERDGEEDTIPSRPNYVYRGHYVTSGCAGTEVGFCTVSWMEWVDEGEGDGGVHVKIAFIDDIKLKITPDTYETGFTADGYLPISHDIMLVTEDCIAFGYPIGSYIVAGVYSATFDPELGRYASVIVDISH